MDRNEIVKKYWFFQSDPTLQKNLMTFGLEIGDGWIDMVNELCEKLEKLLEEFPEVKENFYITQVKEKFGGLRFYISHGNDKIYKLIDEYEDKSFKTCELCGSNEAKQVGGSWINTLCKKCEGEKKK